MSEEKKEVVVPEKFEKLVAEIEKMSVLDLSELVHVLEDKFGVSAAAPVFSISATNFSNFSGTTTSFFSSDICV